MLIIKFTACNLQYYNLIQNYTCVDTDQKGGKETKIYKKLSASMFFNVGVQGGCAISIMVLIPANLASRQVLTKKLSLEVVFYSAPRV